MASNRATKSGFSRDTQAKISAKYDAELARQCIFWICEMINSGSEDEIHVDTDGSAEHVHEILKDGVLLAKLANVLNPGCIAPSKYAKPPKLAFKQMELIGLFTNAVKDFGVPDTETFQTVDLYEQQNMHQVVICLQALGRKAKSRGMVGFGPKEAAANHREFSEEQMLAGRNVISLQMGTNKGASQSGMNFGKQRSILD